MHQAVTPAPSGAGSRGNHLRYRFLGVGVMSELPSTYVLGCLSDSNFFRKKNFPSSGRKRSPSRPSRISPSTISGERRHCSGGRAAEPNAAELPSGPYVRKSTRADSGGLPTRNVTFREVPMVNQQSGK